MPKLPVLINSNHLFPFISSSPSLCTRLLSSNNSDFKAIPGLSFKYTGSVSVNDCSAVFPFSAPSLILARSEITFCFPSRAVSTSAFFA